MPFPDQIWPRASRASFTRLFLNGSAPTRMAHGHAWGRHGAAFRSAQLLPHQPRGPRRRAAGASRAASPPPRSTGAEIVALGTRIKMQICIPVLSLPSSFSVISPGTPHSPAAPKCPCSWGPMAQGLRNKGKRSPRTTRKALAELLARRAGGPHFCSASGLWEPQAS